MKRTEKPEYMVGCVVPRKFWAWLKKEAAAEQKSTAEVIRELLMKFFNERKGVTDGTAK